MRLIGKKCARPHGHVHTFCGLATEKRQYHFSGLPLPYRMLDGCSKEKQPQRHHHKGAGSLSALFNDPG